MCALGLYLAFLVLEDMFTGNYSTNTTVNQNPAFKANYEAYRKSMLQRKNITKRSISKQNIHIPNFSKRPEKPIKKIPSRIVTQKQHDLINMPWRKIRAVVDDRKFYTGAKRINNPTNVHKVKYNPLTFPTPTPMHTTNSRIEFYYMDEAQNAIYEKNYTKPNYKINKIVKTVEETTIPFLIFHIKGPYINPIPLSSKHVVNTSSFRPEKSKISAMQLQKLKELSRKIAASLSNDEIIIKEATTSSTKKVITTKPKTTRPYRLQQSSRQDYFFNSNILMKRAIARTPPNINNFNLETKTISKIINYTESTTVYDKIKFFEIHDTFTRALSRQNDVSVQSNTIKENVTDVNESILLENLNQGSHDHNIAKLEKKHITETPLKVFFLNDEVQSKGFIQNDTYQLEPNRTLYFIHSNMKTEPNTNYTVFSYVNETAHWSDYPFTAVYIYEPSQVHCDAAAISKHWLIASGSCLSRVNSKAKVAFGTEQPASAFVAYCGDNWWRPERVAYVKYTVVHPRYHPRDKIRQHLYNIGAIQVVNSMSSACAAWAPVAIMSHQFVARAEITWATAVGWGLDRFDTRYGATDLPKAPLMTYRSVVYFDSCPGNIGYSKARRLENGEGVRNVHCLWLPPYNGEDADPVHGGLLLADGKLIALYLQEERRPWGDQSAQYTSVWRLIPWLMDTAKEPEEIDTVIFEL